jgi:hypothetical protein
VAADVELEDVLADGDVFRALAHLGDDHIALKKAAQAGKLALEPTRM